MRRFNTSRPPFSAGFFVNKMLARRITSSNYSEELAKIFFIPILLMGGLLVGGPLIAAYKLGQRAERYAQLKEAKKVNISGDASVQTQSAADKMLQKMRLERARQDREAGLFQPIRKMSQDEANEKLAEMVAERQRQNREYLKK